MKNLVAIFAATKYWSDPKELTETISRITEKFSSSDVISVIDGNVAEREYSKDYDVLTVLPISGSVQFDILKFAEKFKRIIIFTAYVSGNFDSDIADKMLYNNASPTVCDVYGVLKRNNDKIVILSKDLSSISNSLRVIDAYDAVKQSKITVIGTPEPWVTSISRDYDLYEKQTGIKFDMASQQELIDIYNETSASEAQEIFNYFAKDARDKINTNDEIVMQCSRLAKAMLKLIENHNSDGIAIACFDLIKKLSVNSCLGVSYINSETDKIAACEGDLDSAVTILMLKKLTGRSAWMANPSFQADKTMNFSHCTAPIRFNGEKLDYTLMNHHETGIGASLRVNYPLGLRINMFRYSAVNNVMSINIGTSIEGRYEPVCRTQIKIAIDDYDNFVETMQGCHQTMMFSDISDDVKMLCKLLKIGVI